MLALEPRIMFDGAMAGDAVDAELCRHEVPNLEDLGAEGQRAATRHLAEHFGSGRPIAERLERQGLGRRRAAGGPRTPPGGLLPGLVRTKPF